MRVVALHRYPLKGFSPERLQRAALAAGGHFPADRMFAVENGPSGFDVANPAHQSKIKFLMLMKNGGIARLTTCYDDETDVLTISSEGHEVARGDLGSAEGRASIAAFLASFVPLEDRRGPLDIIRAPGGFRFTDSGGGYVSLINKASLADLESRLGAPVDQLRFRGNILLEGLKPWEEFELVDQVLAAPSGLKLHVTKRIDRCAATAVDPVTGQRNLPVVKTLMSAFGHIDCGVYARIVEGGTIAEGQHLARIGPFQAFSRELGL